MSGKRTGRIATLTYLVRALLAVPEPKRTGVVGPGAKPWCEFLEETTREMRQDLRPVVLPLLSALIDRADAFTLAQRALVGTAARRILTFAWGESYRDRGMIRLGIEAVCRTFEADLGQSTTLLRRIIEPSRLAEYGFEELPTLARELARLLPVAPGFIESVYRAALAFRESENTPTNMGGGAIFSLTSNRRQDYNMGLYALGELFPRFVTAAPVEATGAVIAAVEARAAGHRTVPIETVVGDAIQFGDWEARFTQDACSVWDGGDRHRHETDLQMLDGFEEGLVRLAGEGGNPELLTQVLARVARENRFAAVWRRILAAAIREPQTLGLRVWTLARATPILVASDTLETVGELLKVVIPLLEPSARESIERAILSLQAPDAWATERYTRKRDRLLGCIGSAHVTTPEARARLEELETTGSPPPNRHPSEMDEETWNEYTEEMWLTEQGVSLDSGPNGRLWALAQTAEQFEKASDHQEPTTEQAEAIVSDLQALHQLLISGEGGANTLVTSRAWTRLTAACANIASAGWLENDAGTVSFIRMILLEAARHEQPHSSEEYNQNIERHGVISPTPRWHAARGLLNLARCSVLATPEVLSAIRALAGDPCVDIRLEVVRYLTRILRTAGDTFWPLLRRAEAVESSRRVIHFALCGVVHLAKHHRRELVELAHAVFNRFRDEVDAKDTEVGVNEIRCDCLRVVLRANSGEADPYGDELVATVLGNLTRFPAEGAYLIQTAADALTIGPVDPPHASTDELRLASFRLLERLARTLLAHFHELDGRTRGILPADWSPDTGPQIEAVNRLADELGFRTYAASGALDDHLGKQNDRRGEISEAARRRFLREGAELLRLISDFPIPRVIHHLLELLEQYSAVDPRAVFLLVARAIRSGSTGGYQYENLGVDLVVRLVRRYLADHRSLLREEPECRDSLIAILNTFVRAGWPQALELTFRLEDIYR